MRKAKNSQGSDKSTRRETAYLLLPWSCKHYPSYSEIEAYIPGRDWEVIAEIPSNPGVDTELVAEFITCIANTYEKDRALLSQTIHALELCLAHSEKHGTAAEPEAQRILRKITSPIEVAAAGYAVSRR